MSTDWRAESPLVPMRLDGAIDRMERYRVPGRFGDLTAGQLSAILYKLDQGWLDDWADLCEFALCDDTLMSLYASRAQRVLQATWKVKPNQFGDPAKAQLAAEFCNEQMGRLLNQGEAMRYMLHAQAVGISCSEKEWDSYHATTGQQTYYLRKVHFRHPHRFRYDDQWKPRLWDSGKYLGAGTGGMWGRTLDPRKWMVHQHYEIVGYPNVSGFMRGAIWVWMFRRWADKFGIMSLEKYGNPFLYAQVPPNTPRASREQIRQDLEDLSNDHAGVMDTGTTIMSLAGMSGQSDSLHGAFMDRYEKRLARLILGTSDAADPGANGSNAAVATRTGSMTDPRMVADGMAIGETWSSSVFGWLLEFNRHRFGGELLPRPTFEAMTASDEVQTDKQDLAEQGGMPPNIPGGSGPTPPPPTASDGTDTPGSSQPSTLAAVPEADLELKYDPSQGRADNGKWTEGFPGASAKKKPSSARKKKTEVGIAKPRAKPKAAAPAPPTAPVSPSAASSPEPATKKGRTKKAATPAQVHPITPEQHEANKAKAAEKLRMHGERAKKAAATRAANKAAKAKASTDAGPKTPTQPTPTPSAESARANPSSAASSKPKASKPALDALSLPVKPSTLDEYHQRAGDIYRTKKGGDVKVSDLIKDPKSKAEAASWSKSWIEDTSLKRAEHAASEIHKEGSWAQSQYAATQAILRHKTDEMRKQGLIDADGYVTLYRGINGPQADAVKSQLKSGGEANLGVYPVSSWTTSKSVAKGFAGGGTSNTSGPKAKGKKSTGVTVKQKVHISRIFSSHFGEKAGDWGNEFEFTVLHPEKSAHVEAG